MATDQASLLSQLRSTAQQRQFYWWLGHVIVVANGIVYFSSVLSLNANSVYYKRAYLGALLSHAVVIYNSIEHTKSKPVSVRSILGDENVHYLVIAFYWYSYQPITVTLVPFFIFSVFHTLSYFSSNILPIIPAKNELASNLNTKINHFTYTYHTTAMQYVAYVEVVGILGRILIGLILFRTSVVALIVFIHFLRLRYYTSGYTKEAIHNTTGHLDKWLLLPDESSSSSQGNAKVLSNIYLSMKRLVSRYASIDTAKTK